MARLPDGTVTFLFSDIEGSTRLLLSKGDEYAELLADQRRLLRSAFAEHHGVEVDTQGDAFFIAFAKATDAVAAGLAAQAALASSELRVRSGSTRASRRSPTRGTSASTCTGPRGS